MLSSLPGRYGNMRARIIGAVHRTRGSAVTVLSSTGEPGNCSNSIHHVYHIRVYACITGCSAFMVKRQLLGISLSDTAGCVPPFSARDFPAKASSFAGWRESGVGLILLSPPQYTPHRMLCLSLSGESVLAYYFHGSPPAGFHFPSTRDGLVASFQLR